MAAAVLSFLSACATTDSAPQLADESLHIRSAFQLIGFRHVVGTLWPVDDGNAVGVSTRFYTGIQLEDGGLAVGAAAQSIRSAVRVLRDMMPSAPLHRAGYIHSDA